MTPEERVKQVYPDAEISSAFAKQRDGSKRWMYCAMSSLKFITSRGKKRRVLNIGIWRFSESDAWTDAAQRLATPDPKETQE